jgi:hypothetical protein
MQELRRSAPVRAAMLGCAKFRGSQARYRRILNKENAGEKVRE